MHSRLILGLASCGLTLATKVSYPMLGWDALRRYDLFSLRPGETTRQFSSHDREDLNDDGFNGTYSCLRNTTDHRCVIAEAKGPGQISDIWFTYERDSIAKPGNIKIELDSQVVLQKEIQDLVDGKAGPPFEWPLVGNTNDTSGGNVIRVPMPYSRSMQVTTSNNPHFYHVTYRKFPPDADVSTFDPNGDALDVLKNIRKNFGIRDPKCRGKKANCPYSQSETHRDCQTFSVDTDKKSKVLTAKGSGIVTELRLRLPKVVGAPHVKDDGRAYGADGGSTFTLSLESGSGRCKLTRRLDQTIGHQRAKVTVDGDKVGEWPDSGSSNNATWLDQTLFLDPEVTAGKDSIVVENSFISSDLDVNEFHYALHCKRGKDDSSSDDWVLMDLLNVGLNNRNDEAAHSYKIKGQTWEGLQYHWYGGDREERAAASVDLITNGYLQMTFDGHRTVKSPIGSFFGSALGKFDARTLMFSTDTFCSNGAFTSWWPMPFKESIALELVNYAGEPLEGSIELTWADWAEDADSEPRWGYFSTHSHREDTVAGKLWNFLSHSGEGVAYGVTQTVRADIQEPDNTMEYLEGDEKVWVNNGGIEGDFEDAVILGTGTEDFYEGGWYYGNGKDPESDNGVAVPNAMPFTGLTGGENQELDCEGACVSMYRVMIPDSMAFSKGISFNIEHGPEKNNIEANYDTTAFYYQALDDD